MQSTPQRRLPTGPARWVAGARPRTLPAAVVPVLVGTACAVGVVPIVAWRFVAALVVAVALQVATNYANDYADGVRGTDAEDRVGPVRLVGSGLAEPRAVKVAAYLAFGVAGLAGFALAAAVSWWLLLVGAAAIAAGWFYTGGPRPYGYAGYGEVFVFVFFGVVATVGSSFVQVGSVTWLAVGASLPVGLLATALLVVNNLRDIPSDTRAAKRTLAVRLGDARTRQLYAACLSGAILLTPVVAIGASRPAALLGLGAVIVAAPPLRAVRTGASGVALIDVLAGTGRSQLVYGLLFATGLALSGWTST